MNLNQKIIKPKLGLLELAKSLGSISPKDLEHAHRLAYNSSYAPSVEKQEEDIELVRVV